MVIGDFVGYSSLGLGAVHAHRAKLPDRAAVTLDAKLDPKAPNEYSVQLPPKVLPAPERIGDVRPPAKRSQQNNDPASRTFSSVADYRFVRHNIDIHI